MWASAQPDGRPAEHRWRPLTEAATYVRQGDHQVGDGRPAEYRWRPLFNAAKFG